MFNKTTSFIFQKYGGILSEISKIQYLQMSHVELKLKNKSIDNFYFYNEDVFIKVNEGIVLLVVSTDTTEPSNEQFVIHRVIKIKAGVFFNFISITTNAKVEIIANFAAKRKISHTYNKIPISYERVVPTINVKEIYAYYYQVRNANYEFPGESHNMWELTFIDNGELETSLDAGFYSLSNFDIILYAPNQYHTQNTLNNKSCSYLTIMFDMECSHPELISNRVFHANRDIHAALNNFIKVSNNQIYYDTDLMICYLKELIIKLFQYDFLSATPVASTPMQQKFENELLNEIIIYINENIYTALTIEEICLQFSISRSSLQTLFKNNLNTAPKQYISDLKLNKSKVLIKESIYTISEISNKLGFASIHYFSRKFKQQFGITPTDYAKTIYN